MAQFFCSPTGSAAGDGSIASPWDILTAWNGSKAATLCKGGNILYMLAGTYRNPDAYAIWPRLFGEQGNDLVVRGYNGRWIFDSVGFNDALFFDSPARAGNFRGDCHDLTVYDMVHICSNAIRSTNAANNNGLFSDLKIIGPRVKMIGLISLDQGNNYSCSMGSDGAQLLDSVLLDAGWRGSDRNHGHAGYVEGLGPTLHDNIITGGSWDILWQEFGTAAKVANVTTSRYLGYGGNVDGGIQFVIGGGGQKYGLKLKDVWLASKEPKYNQMGWQWDGQNGDLTADGMLVVGTGLQFGNWDSLSVKGLRYFGKASGLRMELYTFSKAVPPQQLGQYTFDGNAYAVGTQFALGTRHVDSNGTAINDGTDGVPAATWQTRTNETNSDYAAAPALTIRVDPSLVRKGYAQIKIWNPDMLPSVDVNLSTSGLNPGDAWELTDGFNPLAPPLLTGMYADDQHISIPMTGLVRKSGGLNNPSHPCTDGFGAFVLRGGAALDGSWTHNGVPGPIPVPPPTPVPPPPTGGPMIVNSFTSNPAGLPTGGGSFTLSWDVSGVSSLTLTASPAASFGTSGGAQTLKKTTGNISITQTTVFTLTGSDNTVATLTVPVGAVVTPPPAVTKTWTATGTVPGLSFANGVLSGTPTQAGTFTLVLNVTDSTSKTGTQSVVVTIGAAPVVTPPPAGTLAITPVAVSGTIGVPLSVPFQTN